MRIESVSVSLYMDSDDLLLDNQVEVILFPDSGDDIYPQGMEITSEVQSRIIEIRNICF